MPSNLDKLHDELRELIRQGDNLLNGMQYECHRAEVRAQVEGLLSKDGKKAAAAEVDEILERFPNFKAQYQPWYSEAMAVVKQLLPDRLENFTGLYEKPKSRKNLSWGSYVISDYLQGLQAYNGQVNPSAAIPQMQQQVNILKACERRFQSSLFEIKQLVQADLFDSELDGAREMVKHKFHRAAGAIAGVVLEKHLVQVCSNHSIVLPKKHLSIGDLNDLLKKNSVIETPLWRGIQRLGDLRNLCDHHKGKEPTVDDVGELIDSVEKLIKTLF